MSRELDGAIAELEGFLRRYPSGHFNELAQARLDRLLAERGEAKVTAVPAPGNPFGKGVVAASPAYSVGDRYEFRYLDGYTGSERERRVDQVTSVSALEVVYNDGQLVTDLLGNGSVRRDGTRFVDAQHFAAEYFIGKKWRTRYTYTFPNGRSDETTIDYVVVAREEVVVPAGRFNAFRIEGEGFQLRSGRRHFVSWVAPDRVRRPVARDLNRWLPTTFNSGPQRERIEMVSFVEKVSPGG